MWTHWQGGSGKPRAAPDVEIDERVPDRRAPCARFYPRKQTSTLLQPIPPASGILGRFSGLLVLDTSNEASRERSWNQLETSDHSRSVTRLRGIIANGLDTTSFTYCLAAPSSSPTPMSEFNAVHPPAVKVGGRRLSASRPKHNPHNVKCVLESPFSRPVSSIFRDEIG